MSFVRNEIEFCNKIRVSAFLVKIEFPLKRTKNKPVVREFRFFPYCKAGENEVCIKKILTWH